MFGGADYGNIYTKNLFINTFFTLYMVDKNGHLYIIYI